MPPDAKHSGSYNDGLDLAAAVMVIASIPLLLLKTPESSENRPFQFVN